VLAGNVADGTTERITAHRCIPARANHDGPVDRRIRQFFPDIRAALTPLVECFGNFYLEQAELQWDIGGIEPFCDLIFPCQFLS